MVAHASSWRYGARFKLGMCATLSLASSKGCGSLGFRADDGAAGQVVRFRWEIARLKLITRQLKIIQHHKVFVALAGWHPC